MKKYVGLFIAWGLFLLSAVAFAAANYEENVVEAEGYGLSAAGSATEVQARLTARRAAIADAQRVLAEEMAAVQVDAETRVEDAALKSDVVQTKVTALLKGCRVVRESYEDGAYRVTVAVPLFGERSLAAAALPRKSGRQPFPLAASLSRDEAAEEYGPREPVESGPYTGLILDCRGLDLRPAMSPVIKTTAGEPIYGYKNLDSAEVIRRGMAGYAHTFEDNTARAGENPLILRAAGVDRYFNPVVTAEDGGWILRENEKTHFLDKAAVVFVR